MTEIDFQEWKSMQTTREIMKHLRELREEIKEEMLVYAGSPNNEIVCSKWAGYALALQDLLELEFADLARFEDTPVEEEEEVYE